MVVKKQSAKTAQLYAYSFDRKTWQGDFNSREEAIQAGMTDEHNKECLVVYTGIAKLYTPVLKSETVLDILKIEADEIAGVAAAKKPDFYESISSVQAHGIDDYFKKK